MADTGGTVTITAMLIESDPSMPSYSGYEAPAPLAPEYADLDQCWVDALKTLLVNVDAAHCWRCDEGVGFTLYGDGDQFVQWVSTGLAREGDGPVAVLCEDCTPYVPEQPQATPALVDDGTYALPPHLRDDAPFAVCGHCQRKTWAVSEFGQECRMPQPDGKPCGGRFSSPAAQS